MLHGGTFSSRRVIWEIIDTIRKYMKIRFNMDCDNKNWPEIIVMLDRFRPSYNFRIVKWIPPYIQWFKCNTDGVDKGNPGQFCCFLY